MTDDDGDRLIDPEHFLVARLHGHRGPLDPGFGTGGSARGRFADASHGDGAWGVTLDASGRPIVNGYTSVDRAAVHRVGLARLDDDLNFTDDLEAAPRGRLPGQQASTRRPAAYTARVSAPPIQ